MLSSSTARPNLPGTIYWLITGDQNNRSGMLTIDRNGEEMLPVFSFREEAEMFFSLGMLGAGWSLRRTTAGELASILKGPCARINFVALDPLPEMVCRGMIDLVSLSRERFMRRLAVSFEYSGAAIRG